MENYHQQQTKAMPVFPDLFWQLPEQKTGLLTIVGGHQGSFLTTIKTTEYSLKLPLKTVELLLPDCLKTKLPPLPHLHFAPSSQSGSFARSAQLFPPQTDFLLAIGDFSKNAETCLALINSVKNSAKPFLLTRDTVDILTPEFSTIIENPHLHLLATIPQLQKIFRQIYYPKMLLLSSPLHATVDIFHKFTLSYPLTLLTLHQSQLIAAKNGKVYTTPLAETKTSLFSFINGSLAAKFATLSLLTADPLAAAASAPLWEP